LAYHRGDHQAAFETWSALAEQGHAAAQYSLGFMYYRGDGMLPDLKKAVHWYRLAAEQGDPDAQLNLGLMYAQGEGLKTDYVQAYKWFSLASQAYPAGENRDICVKNLLNVQAVMTEKEIAKADGLVKRWTPKRG
jgi:TPR repeat protein